MRLGRPAGKLLAGLVTTRGRPAGALRRRALRGLPGVQTAASARHPRAPAAPACPHIKAPKIQLGSNAGLSEPRRPAPHCQLLSSVPRRAAPRRTAAARPQWASARRSPRARGRARSRWPTRWWTWTVGGSSQDFLITTVSLLCSVAEGATLFGEAQRGGHSPGSGEAVGGLLRLQRPESIGKFFGGCPSA